MPYSKFMNPVMLPPGRERLSTKPAATGSETSTNTIGTVRVAGCNAPTIGVAAAKMTSGARAANSAAYLRISSVLLAAQQRQPPSGRPRLPHSIGHQTGPAPLGAVRVRRDGGELRCPGIEFYLWTRSRFPVAESQSGLYYTQAGAGDDEHRVADETSSARDVGPRQHEQWSRPDKADAIGVDF